MTYYENNKDAALNIKVKRVNSWGVLTSQIKDRQGTVNNARSMSTHTGRGYCKRLTDSVNRKKASARTFFHVRISAKYLTVLFRKLKLGMKQT